MLLFPAFLAFSAHACESSGPRGLWVDLLPVDGADDVPRDSAVRAWSNPNVGTGEAPPDDALVVVRDDGEEVVGSLSRGPTEVVLVPAEPLLSGRTYTATFGGRTSTFTIGDGLTEPLDGPPSAEGLRVRERRYLDDMCTPFGHISTWRDVAGPLGEAPTPDQVLNAYPLVLVSLADAAGEPSDEPSFSVGTGGGVGWKVEDELPSIQCLKLQGEDAAGRRTGWGDTVCVDVDVEKTGCNAAGGRAGVFLILAAILGVRRRQTSQPSRG